MNTEPSINEKITNLECSLKNNNFCGLLKDCANSTVSRYVNNKMLIVVCKNLLCKNRISYGYETVCTHPLRAEMYKKNIT